jgi:hypothetical protein
MKQKGVALVPTDIDDFSLKRYVERQRRPGPSPSLTGFLTASCERLRRAIAAGVTIVSGSDNYIDMGMPDPVQDFNAIERVKFVMKNGKVYVETK